MRAGPLARSRRSEHWFGPVVGGCGLDRRKNERGDNRPKSISTDTTGDAPTNTARQLGLWQSLEIGRCLDLATTERTGITVSRPAVALPVVVTAWVTRFFLGVASTLVARYRNSQPHRTVHRDRCDLICAASYFGKTASRPSYPSYFLPD